MGSSSSGRRDHDARPFGFLEFEVLGGQVTDPEWRFGDEIAKSFRSSKPYVKVTFDDREEESDYVRIRPGGETVFSARLDFPLYPFSTPDGASCTSWNAGVDLPRQMVHVAVYEHRKFKGVRGHPLVGEASLEIGKECLNSRLRQELKLLRKGEVHGNLLVQYRIVELEGICSVLFDQKTHNSQEVMQAMVVVLKAPDNLNRILAARPSVLKRWGDEHTTKKSVKELRSKFMQSEGVMADSEASTAQLVSFTRGFIRITAEQLATNPEADPVATCAEWIRALFTTCIDQGMMMESSVLGPQICDERLRRCLLTASIEFQDLVPVDSRGVQVPTTNDWTPDQTVPDRAVIGSGSFGIVWGAKDPVTNALFAVKTINLKGVRKNVAAREGEVAARLCLLAHPNVVQLYKVQEHPARNRYSIVMELALGGDLGTKIQSAWENDVYTCPPEAFKWTGQIFLGLEHLHLGAGMLLRDVKPDNVVLSADGTAKLTDFGFSSLDTYSTGNFTFGIPPGTPTYVAPEVLSGAGYDFNADLYSFGVLTYVVLTGGVIGASEPRPPCANMTHGLDIGPLLNNWQLIASSVKDPTRNNMFELPSEDAKHFVLMLTDRSSGPSHLSHEDLREHAFMQLLGIPPRKEEEINQDTSLSSV